MSARLKKIIAIIFLFTFAFNVFAPGNNTLVIIDNPPVEPFRRLIQAIGIVETKGDTLAYNPVEKAVGYFQIRPIRLNDYNKRTHSRLSPHDLFDYNISEKIFLYYASKIGPYDFQRIAREWNGSGKKTYQYWKEVKKNLVMLNTKRSGSTS
ncbi:MAG: hypothetical protein EPN88_14300 [Bacteroidetes bacterium]|nr:MAG: hypothetical protein EPN88_14300 [Bacteroidota bacterium]